MGTNMKEILDKRLKVAGCAPPVVKPSGKLFRFGGDSNILTANEVM